MPSAEQATPDQNASGMVVMDQSWANAEKLTGKRPHRTTKAGKRAFILV
jgi:hypothetical protein